MDQLQTNHLSFITLSGIVSLIEEPFLDRHQNIDSKTSLKPCSSL